MHSLLIFLGKNIKIMLFSLCFFIFQHTKKIFIFKNVKNCGSLRVHQSVQRVRGKLAGNLDCQ